MKTVSQTFLLLSSILLFVNPTFSQSMRESDSLTIHHKLHKHPFPLWIGNIKIGKTNDLLIIKRFGTGIFDSMDGHGGARYFIDQKKQVFLKTVIGVDGIIEEAALSTKEYPFDFVESIRSFPTKAISQNFSILTKTESNIGFGMTIGSVKKILGTPNRYEHKADLTTLYYEDSNDQWTQVIFYQAAFTFRKDKLIRIDIYDGE
jgi:hypothetical protein